MKQTLLEHILYPTKRINEINLHNTLRGKAILITGASYGIGESIAYRLAAKDTTLILVARTQEKLESIKVDLENRGANVHIICCDLYDMHQVDNLIVAIKNLNIEIDIFINNAGKSICRPIENSLDRFHDFTRTTSINYYAPVKIMLYLIPTLAKKRGHVINISAINVLFAPAPNWAAYQASKTAMDNWLRSALPELKANKIAVTSIYLPLVKTRMIAPNEAYRDAPTMKPEQAANIVCNTIIRRNNKWKPWWSIFPQIGSVLFRNLWEYICTYYIKKNGKSI